MSDNATLVGSLPQAGGVATLSTSQGLVTGIYAGTGAGITVGSKTYYPA